MVKQFEPEQVYMEKAVNEIILRMHEDCCPMRREMIMEGLMSRR